MPATSDDYPFKNLGKHQRPITTSSPDAQLWFNRGFAWYLGFNFAEAIFCFRQALEIDPNCLFAYWGIAACTGIHYNDPECSDPELARDMLNKAKHLIDGSAPDTFMPVEVALINALRVRHFQPAGTTIEERDKAYSAAMEEVYQQFGKDDADIIAIYVDSLMQLTPWRLWRNGTMADDTRIADILRLLEDGLAIAPNHPGLLHFHIHAWEMSPTPEKAKGTADRLRHLVPDAGHLDHMPSHIDVLLGDYPAAIAANERAVAVDRKFLAERGPEGFYTLYRFHDLHLLVYAAMFAGCYEKAIAAALELASTPETVIADRPDWLESFMAVPYHVWLRFGKWQTVLDQPPVSDPEVFCTTEATRLFARAVALAALERPEEAEQERLVFEAARAKVPASRTLFNNTAQGLLNVSAGLALGEVRYREAKYDEAFQALRKAVKDADELIYDEPEGQMMPVRHALGALLLEQDHVEEAEQVLREDLAKHPNNIWALRGLDECLARTGRGDGEEARKIKAELAKLERVADLPIGTSCFCRLKL